MTGLDLNRFMSPFVDWGFNSDWIQKMVTLFGCRIEQLSIKYLGLPLGVHYKQSKHWKHVVHKMK